MPPASIDPSLKVEKTFTYRGVPKVFSNRYHFDNLSPSDAAHWTTLSDAIVTAEKAIFESGWGLTITGTTGYDAGSEIPVFSKAYSTAATGVFTSASQVPGDCVALVRYATNARSVKNHPIFLFNYYHQPAYGTGGVADTLHTAMRTAMATYAASWITGFSDGAVTHHRCGPQGHVATGALVDPFIRHRDFPAG